MDPIVTPLVVGGAIQGIGSIFGASGAKKAGKEQAQVARESLAFQKEVYEQAKLDQQKYMREAMAISAPTVAQLAAMDRMVTTNERQTEFTMKQIQSAEEALAAVNPAIVAAGQEAYRLIQGEPSKTLKPLRDTRSRQKIELENALAQRLGPGFRSTAAGIKALNDFDNQTSDALNSAQVGALSTVVNSLQGLSAVSAQQGANAQTGAQSALGGASAIIDAQKGLVSQQLQPYYLGAQLRPDASGRGAAQQTLAGVVGNQQAGTIGLGQGLASLGGQIGQVALMQSLLVPQGGAGIPTYQTPTNNVSMPSLGSSSLPTQSYTLGDFNF